MQYKNLELYKNEVIKYLSEIIKVNTIKNNPIPNSEFGLGIQQGFCALKKIAQNLGFEKITNYENKVMEIDYGYGDEILGIVCHLDTVPVTKDWVHDPFGAEIENNKIYGRGALDDKGPLIINLVALKYIKDHSIALNKQIRFIIGGDEESGSACLEYYFNKLKKPQPEIAYTPDANFPVIYAEKGIIRLKLVSTFKTLNGIEIIGGNAFNAVASELKATIPQDDIDSYCLFEDHINVKLTNHNYIFSNIGKSAHAAKPELGKNAISYFFNNVQINSKNQELNNLFDFFKQFIGIEYSGNKFGINVQDETGSLTLNIGMIRLQNNKLEIAIDIRVPTSFKPNDIIQTIIKTIPTWMQVQVCEIDEPLFQDPQCFLIQTLLHIYQKHTNDKKTKPLAIGGGTYARKLTNGVAFGALLNTQVDNMHQNDEYLDLDVIETLLKIYIDAIVQLAQ